MRTEISPQYLLPDPVEIEYEICRQSRIINKLHVQSNQSN